MKNTKPMRKVLSLVLTLVMVFGSFGGTGIFAATEENKVYTNGAVSWEVVEGSLYPTAHASEKLAPVVDETPEYKDTDIVRVSIVLKDDSTIKKFATEDIANNKQAMKYRANLEKEQDKVSSKISKKVLDGETLDVVWNLTLAANIISANVEFGKIEEIKALADVADVFVENCYEAQAAESSDKPNMGPSSGMIGSPVAWAAGYTGAGSKVAIVDTGVDTDHQSFAEDGYVYAMKKNAEAAGKSYDEYLASVGVLTAADVAAVWDQLNASKFSAANAAGAYLTAKIPFAVNYVDENLVVDHDHDGQGEHGSHVTGISAGNRYINNNGSFEDALTYVGTQGVAPDAQIVTMKVFGAGGGAYDSDYMSAIEDAIVLGCDSVNLSLGSAAPGREFAGEYEHVMEDITKSGTVVVMSAGNSGNWFENTLYSNTSIGTGLLYADDVAIDTVGSPGSFTNTLAVASIDNCGVSGAPLKFGDLTAFYTETSGYSNPPLASTLPGTQEYVFFENTGVDGSNNNLIMPYADVVKGKIVMVYRGTSSFYQKMDAAAAAGASACIVVNNQAGTINMDLSDASSTIPCVSITQADGEAVKERSTNAGEYYTGTVDVCTVVEINNSGAEYYTMSDFSSWGVPGSLELKPEITAPGGSIYSVNGAIAGGKSYELMSGTSMAAPQTTGMVAVFAQYLRENGLADQLGYSARQLANSLLMSTAAPVMEDFGGYTNGAGEEDGYYSVLKQGSGLAQVDKAVNAKTFLMMADNATKSAADGKIKVELGDDPEREGVYTFGFSINNMESVNKNFNLYADMFTQDVYDAFGDGTMVMDTWTTPLASTVVWKVNGETVVPDDAIMAYDFNGDGVVDENDGQALLDLSTGVITSIENADKADFDGDGDVDTYDAYLFFKLISEAAVVVPADGKVDVECTITLQDIDDYDYAGAFVEGYVYAEELTSEEGVLGDLHSIPVLGYYGSWTEPGMFDKGSTSEYDSGEEERLPYLYLENYTEYENALLVNYPDEPTTSHIFGGNPVFWDDEYMPERDAISGVNGMKVAGIQYTLIRNAEQGLLKIVDENGKEYYNQSLGALNSAYYYTNKSAWYNTIGVAKIGSALTGAEDGAKLTASLTVVPEYYTIGGQTVDYDALGEGATKSFSFTVDNVAPEIVNIEVQKDDVSDERFLVLTVKDNQYVAGVFVLDNLGKQIDSYGSDPDAEAGDETVYKIPVDGYEKVNVQIYDYAYNAISTRIKVDPDAPPVPVTGITVTPESAELLKNETISLTAIVAPDDADNIGVVWSSSNESVATVTQNGVVTAVGEGTATITATSAENDTIFDTAEITVETLKVTLHGVIQDAEGNPETFTWNLETDSTWTKGVALPNDIVAFTDDQLYSFGEDGEMGGYVQDSAGFLHLVSLETGTEFDKSESSVAFGMPMNDLAMAYGINETLAEAGVYSEIMAGVAQPYLLYSQDMNNSFGSGWNLGAYGQALCWAGTVPFSATVTLDTFFVIDDNGTVWFFGADFTTGKLYSGGSYSTGLNLEWPGFEYVAGTTNSNCSLCIGDDGNLYLSYFNGSTNEVYQLVEDSDTGNYTSRFLCDVGDGVWPCSIYAVTLNGASAAKAPAERTVNFAVAPQFEFKADAQEIKLETKANGSLNAVAAPAAKQPVNKVTGGLNAVGDKYTLEVTAEEDSTNGKIEITWDPAAAELVSFDSDADYTSVLDDSANGKVVFAYADVDGIAAGDALAEIEFTKLATPAVAHVKFVEFNENGEGDVDNEFDVCIPDHCDDTEVRDAKDPTCTEDGYSGDIYCLDCGELVEEGTVVSATGHKAGDAVNENVVPATCTKDGSHDEVTYCTECGKELSRETITDPAEGHDWSDWEQTKAPTCVEAGEETRECFVCHETETRPVDAKGHGEAVVELAKDPTCTEDGYTGDKVCPDCGAVLESGELIPALGHEEEIVGAKEATCTEDGYTGDKVCSVCEEVLEKGEVIPATGHTWGDWAETKAPTCTEEGEETRECSVCHAKETRPVAAKGHNFDTEKPEYDWNEDKTECTISFPCTECGEKDEHECTVTEEVVTEATETEPGLKKVTATYSPKAGIVYTDTVEVIIPVKKAPDTGLVISGIGALGALGAAAYVFARKRKEDEE